MAAHVGQLAHALLQHIPSVIHTDGAITAHVACCASTFVWEHEVQHRRRLHLPHLINSRNRYTCSQTHPYLDAGTIVLVAANTQVQAADGVAKVVCVSTLSCTDSSTTSTRFNPATYVRVLQSYPSQPSAQSQVSGPIQLPWLKQT